MRLTPNNVRIAARHSDLARLQAYRVGDALRAAHPELTVQYSFRASLGDQNQTDPLWKMPEKGVFTEDFLLDLVNETADLVVHSWKDLPTEPRSDTEIVATLPRADVRDLLLFRRDRLGDCGSRVRILTSSPRRAHNLEGFLKTHLPFDVSEVVFQNVRGNIPTRLKKLLKEDCEGLIVAKAALDRLLIAPEPEFAEVRAVIQNVLSQTKFMVLPLTVNPTAAAQGALAIEIKKNRPDLRKLLNDIHCPETFAAVEKERAILKSYGGGCHQKIGVSVLPKDYGEWLYLRGVTDKGEVLDRVQLTANTESQKRSSAPDAPLTVPSFFEREELPRSQWQWAEDEKYLWVARESAWPQSFKPSGDAVVWTAGLQTWRKLAARGVWVAGSVEGLGEDEPTGIEALVGKSATVQGLKWLKLTHSRAGEFAGQPSPDETNKSCATYKLVDRNVIPNLVGKTHFYWASASNFERAFELFPDEIRRGAHACGPGLTYKHIRRVLGPAANLRIEVRPPPGVLPNS